MRRFVPATVAGSMLLVAGSCAMALGMGRVSTLSNLGAPLEFSVALSAQAADNLSAECISAEVYAGERRVPPEMVSVRVNRASDGTPASLRVSTGTRIDEPVASVELMLDCGTRVSRKYVVFIDPPMLNLAQAGDSRPAEGSAAETRRDPSARDVAPRTAPRRARSTGSASTLRPGGTGVASAARQRRSQAAAAARAARAAAPVVAQPGSRLKLESAPAPQAAAPVRERTPSAGAPGAAQVAGVAGTGSTPPVAAVASGPASAALAAAAGASASMGGLLSELAAKAEADALALNAERLRSLEESLLRLRTDNQSMQKSMLDLQARLQEAESSRYANPVVYGLLALLGLLLLAVIALLWRQAGLRKESEWLRAAAAKEIAEAPAAPAVRSVTRPTGAAAVRPAAASAAPAGLFDEAAAQAAERPKGSTASAVGDAGAVVDDAPRSAAATTLPPTAAVAAQATTVLPPREASSAHDPRREVSVEELIDLEQQADFFVVLGQDDAAVDLLMGHVQGTGGASPLPYLKLLEIHRRRDEREAYDRVRERFNRRFSAFAPEWEAHSGHDRALEDYPAVIAHLQDLWREPTAAMDELAALLFQRDPTAQTFDLSAYGELLFLYSLARELAEDQPSVDGVDLLLPLDDPGPATRNDAPVAVGAAALATGGFSAAAQPADQLGELSFAAIPGLDELPSIPGLPPASHSPPLGFTSPHGESDGPPALEGGLLDLNISNEPEEPKGPLSKH